jgi:hypothetical protein
MEGVSTFAGSLEAVSAVQAETVLERPLTRYLVAVVGS